MTKSSQKKGQNYIPFLQSTYPAMQRKTSSGGQGAPAARQSGTCVPGPLWAGGSSCTPERRATPAHGGQGELRPRARPARATLAPSGQGGLWLRVRGAHVPPPPVGRGGSGHTPERRVRPGTPVGRENSGRVPDQRARP